MSTRGDEVGYYNGPPSGKAVSKRQGWARRYWRYVNGRVEILRPAFPRTPKIKLIRQAQKQLKPIFKEYAEARKRSYDLFNNERVKQQVMARGQTEATKRSAMRQEIRIARSNQARLRGKLTKMTGVGIQSHAFGSEEHIIGES